MTYQERSEKTAQSTNWSEFIDYAKDHEHTNWYLIDPTIDEGDPGRYKFLDKRGHYGKEIPWRWVNANLRDD